MTEKWEKDYPNVMKSWHKNWDVISPIFKFSAEVRKVIYTTNAIESLNSGYRRLNKQRSVFPSDTALLKALYLATHEIAKNGLCRFGTGVRYWESWRSCIPTGSAISLIPFRCTPFRQADSRSILTIYSIHCIL